MTEKTKGTTRTRSRAAPKKAASAKKPTKKVAPKKAKSTTPVLDALTGDLTKRFGDKTMRKGTQVIPCAHISTGIFMLDYCSLGGIPDGYLSQYYGWEHSGKTTNALKAVAEAQRKYPDKVAVFIDAETHLNDMVWVASQGVDIDRLRIITDAGVAENYADIFDSLMKTGEVSIIVMDSLVTLIPKDESEKSAVDTPKIAGKASVIGRMCSSILVARQQNNQSGLHTPSIIFINQYRNKAGFHMGADTSLPGGNYPKFLSMLNIQLKKGQPTYLDGKSAEDASAKQYVTGAKHAFKIEKCKMGKTLDHSDYKLVTSPVHNTLTMGDVDEDIEVVNYAKRHGVLMGSGGHYRLAVAGDQKFSKMADVGEWLIQEENQEAYRLVKAGIIALVRRKIGKTPIPYDNHLMGCDGKDVMDMLEVTFS